MNWIKRLFARRQLEADLAAEIRGHLDERVADLVSRGLSRAEAIRQARREFGNVSLIEERAREVWRWRWIEDFLFDLRFALRQVRKAPGFATAATLTLAIGIGATTAVFSVVNAVVLRPLPFEQPGRLVSVWPSGEAGPAGPYNVSYPNFFDFRSENSVFEHLVSYRSTSISLTGAGEPVQLRGEIVSWDLFPLLGVQPLLGRGFLATDEEPGTRAVILGHALWSTRFAADAGMIGRTIELAGEPWLVVGVAPPSFSFPVAGESVQVWVPSAVDAGGGTVRPLTVQRGARTLSLMGRLRDGVSIEQATAQMNGIAASLAARYPENNERYPRVYLQPALVETAGRARAPLLLLLGAVGCVLLLACANVANLLLSRNAEREREFALRLAIGAPRERLVRQVLAEAFALALFGAVGGVVLAWLLVGFAAPLGAAAVPRMAETRVDAGVLVFALALTIATAVFCSAAPVVRLRRGVANSPLKEGAYANVKGRDRLGGAFVVAQVALGLTLLTGAGLLTAGFVHVTRQHPGFQPEQLLTFAIAVPESRYAGARQVDLYGQLLERLADVPDARSAALAMPLPLTGSSMSVGFDIEGRPAPPSDRSRSDIAIVSTEFFRTAGIPLLEGRGFSDQDDRDRPPVLIVNRAFAERFFPGESVIGKRILPGVITDRGPQWREIVGIVGDAKQSPFASRPEPVYYFPYRQLPWCCPYIVVRSAGAPESLEPSVRSVVASLDRQLPVFDVRPADQLAAGQMRPATFATLLMISFATIALLLTAIGLYGVLSYDVVKRTREIGIRIALGATRRTVLAGVVRRAALLIAIGVALGIAGSIAVRRVAGTIVFGVDNGGSLLLIGAVSVMLAAAWLATYWPARRAAAIEPMLALRGE
jgi:putative ABC transport system permease protein